jgi:hypothetical protein
VRIIEILENDVGEIDWELRVRRVNDSENIEEGEKSEKGGAIRCDTGGMGRRCQRLASVSPLAPGAMSRRGAFTVFSSE